MSTAPQRDPVAAACARFERIALGLSRGRSLAIELRPATESALERLARHVVEGWTRVVIGRGARGVTVESHRPLDSRAASLVVPPHDDHELRAAPRRLQLLVLASAAELLTAIALAAEDRPDADAILLAATECMDALDDVDPQIAVDSETSAEASA